MKFPLALAVLFSALLVGVAPAMDPAAVQEAYLKASNAGGSDVFGHSVAIFGTTVVVGATHEDGSGTGGGANNSVTNAGAAYVYGIQPDGSWVQQAYLKASNADAHDRFGQSVGISGNTIVVGAYGEDSDGSGEASNDASGAGAAYVFEKIGGQWIQTAYLKASNAEAGDTFGNSVAISGEKIVVAAGLEDGNGTDGESDNSASDSGALYVFGKDGNGTWKQEAYLKSSNAEAGDGLGSGVALERRGPYRQFYQSTSAVSIHGDTIVAGAYGEDGNGVDGEDKNDATDAGAAYVFVNEGDTWVEQAYLKASNADAGDSFGFSVSVWGDTVVIGATLEGGNGADGEGDNSASNAGAAYVYSRDEMGIWTQQAYLKASNAEAGDTFGRSVSLFHDAIVVGAREENSGNPENEADNSAYNSGAAFLFTRESGEWTQQAYLKASNVESRDEFGSAVAISGRYAIIGAMFEDAGSNGDNGANDNNNAGSAGAAYLFHLPFVTLPADPDSASGPGSGYERPVRRPDLHIGTSWNRLAGDDRYDRRKASSRQTLNLPGRIFRTHTATANLLLENDGNRRDTYRFSVNGTGNPGIAAKAFASGKRGNRKNIAGDLKRKGYIFTLAPGGTERVMYQVKTDRFWAGARNRGGRLNRFAFTLKGAGKSDVGELVTQFR